MIMNEDDNHVNQDASFLLHEPGDVKVLASDLKTGKYQSLLFQIANHFGFSEKEAFKLIEEVYSYSQRLYNDEKNQLPLRILLSKVMVHKCIFKISCRMFSENIFTGITGSSSFYCNRNAFEACEKGMPLSYLTVYILSSILGFSEREIAGILNTTTLQVRERLTKAQTMTVNNR
jgi:hypothetical protein